MKVSPKDAHLILTEDTFPVIEQITAGMPGGFFIYRASGKEELIYANQALIQMYGCQDEKDFWSYTGGTFQGLVYPEDWERVSQSIRQQIVEEGRDLDRVDYRIIRKDGELRWIEDYGHFVHTGAYGDVFYVFLSDVTERTLRRLDEERVVRLTAERKNALVSLEHEATALKLIHEILRSGMWAMEFDEAGEMASVFWSDDFRRMLGYKNQTDFPNRLESWSNLIYPEDRETVLLEFHAAIDDPTGRFIFDVEYRMETKDQGWRWFRTTGKLSRREDGTPITFVGIFVDITQEKDIDETLQNQHQLLEEALEEAQQSNRAKTVFLNNMSHDVRTPLNAILGFAALAATHLENRELVGDYLNKIQVAGRHLLSLISGVLDMSCIESGEIHLENAPCSLEELLQDLDIMIREEAESKGLTLSIQRALHHPEVVCDRLRLGQVLLNVVGNAVKFTPAGGNILVEAVETPGPEGSGEYRFLIADTGIGMSQTFLGHIFEPFERESTSTLSGIQGAGLGMTITKNIIDAMGGEILVESREGEGSRFLIRLTLPLALGSSGQAGGPDKEKASLEGRRILLVEDNHLNREIAATILEEEGLLVEEAWDGAAAVEKLAGSQPGYYELILMDIQMPVMDGYEATRQIRRLRDPRLAGIPILAMTANALEEDKQKAFMAGMDGHLTKPVEVEKLIMTLREKLCPGG